MRSTRLLVLLALLLLASGAVAAEEPADAEAAVAARRAEILRSLAESSIAVTPYEERVYLGEPIDLSLRDADLVEVLRSFAKLGDFNLVLDPAVKGSVTVEFRQVPWDQALEQILKANGLGMEVTGNVVGVTRRR